MDSEIYGKETDLIYPVGPWGGFEMKDTTRFFFFFFQMRFYYFTNNDPVNIPQWTGKLSEHSRKGDCHVNEVTRRFAYCVNLFLACKILFRRDVLACMLRLSFSRVLLFSTPWTVPHQAPPSMRFSWQEHWTDLPRPLPGDPPRN